MKNMESLQLVKEQLKIKAVELRKAHEENGNVKKQIKDLITFNQTEVKKLKEVVKHAEGEAAEQKSQAEAARLAKHVGVEAGKKEKQEEEAEIAERIEAKMDDKILTEPMLSGNALKKRKIPIKSFRENGTF
jgi:hydroxylamine reductase (hybrid-cluster protein)